MFGSKITSLIHISIVSLFPFITLSFAKNCSINSFHKIIYKDNAKKVLFNKLCKKINKIFNQKNPKKSNKKHLQANGLKGLEETFTNNGI
jgi:hypothetical protein